MQSLLTKKDSEDQYQEEDDESGNGAAAESDEDDSELDEDAPPRVTIIPLEKLRDDGGVEYEDHKLHRNTMLFLRDLKANNKRPWLKCKLCSHSHLNHDGQPYEGQET
jgi:hypothetical protein